MLFFFTSSRICVQAAVAELSYAAFLDTLLGK